MQRSRIYRLNPAPEATEADTPLMADGRMFGPRRRAGRELPGIDDPDPDPEAELQGLVYGHLAGDPPHPC